MKEIYNNYKIDTDGSIYNKYGKKLKPSDNGKGYLIVGLRVEGKYITKAVHRLLAEAFIDNPENKPEVNHIDANRLNNELNNLEWVSHGENIQHSYNLKNRSALGSNNANCKTDEETVKQICEYIASGLSSSEIRDLGYSYTLVRSIKVKNNWKHISDLYF